MPSPLICACCGRRYGKKAIKREHVVVEIGKPIPAPRSNLPVISTEYMPALPPEGPATPEEATGFIPMDEGKEFWQGPPAHKFGNNTYSGRKGRRVVWEMWDGETYWGQYDPFCTLKCALDFAQAAHKAGYRIKR